MQGKPYSRFQELPSFLAQETDTATPRILVSIFYMHEGSTPFCTNARCFCQRGRRAGAILYPDIAVGKLLLAQLRTDDLPTLHHIYVPFVEDIPEECQLYGHAWELTESLDVKECTICHLRGYCPECTPQAPAGVQPFYCTEHTQQRQGER